MSRWGISLSFHKYKTHTIRQPLHHHHHHHVWGYFRVLNFMWSLHAPTQTWSHKASLKNFLVFVSGWCHGLLKVLLAGQTLPVSCLWHETWRHGSSWQLLITSILHAHVQDHWRVSTLEGKVVSLRDEVQHVAQHVWGHTFKQEEKKMEQETPTWHFSAVCSETETE